MLTLDQKYRIIYRKFAENKPGSPVCPICGNSYRHSFQRQSLKQHIEDAHAEIFDEYCNLIISYEQKRVASQVICPICGKFEKNTLSVHLQADHNYTDLNAFRLEYPEYPISVKKPKQQISCICEICGKTYNYSNALTNHKRIEHGIQKEKLLLLPKSGHFCCLICGFQTNSLKDHITKKHRIEWDSYCLEYHHDPKQKAFHTESHNKKVSDGKLAYYASDASIENKKALSKKSSGDNNPAKRPEIRKKISQAQAAHLQQYDLDFCSPRGLRICCHDIGLTKYTRSFQEFKVAYTLFKNGISYDYEPNYIHLQDRSYVPDFKINATNLMNINFEIKSNYYQVDYNKYKIISQQLKLLGQELKILTYEDFCCFLNIEKIPEKDILRYCSEMILQDRMQIMCMVIAGRHSRLLERICPEYKTNKNIRYIECNNKKE